MSNQEEQPCDTTRQGQGSVNAGTGQPAQHLFGATHIQGTLWYPVRSSLTGTVPTT